MSMDGGFTMELAKCLSRFYTFITFYKPNPISRRPIFLPDCIKMYIQPYIYR